MGENKKITQTSQNVNPKQTQQSFGLSASDIKKIVIIGANFRIKGYLLALKKRL